MKELAKNRIDHSQLKMISQDILHLAKRMGASEAEVSMSANHGFSVAARNNDVETVEYNQDKDIGITVYFGKRTGSASLSDIRPEAIKAAVEAACHIAKFTDEDIATGLADKELMATDFPKLELSYPWDISVEKAIELAIACEQEALQQDKRIMSAENVSVGTTQLWALYANSHGFLGEFPYTRHDISCVLIAKEKEEMQREYSYTTGVDPALLNSVSQVAKEAVARTVQRLGAKTLPTMQAPVIFVAEEARTLLSSFISAISGGNLYRKSSFLLDHLGKRVFPEFMQIAEQPLLEKGMGSAAFDGDGLLTRNNVFVKDGILNSYALSVYSARKLNMAPTANSGGVHNLIVKTGNKNLHEMLRTMGRGLLITEMMGHGTNIITGDYSRGAAGFWVENGEIQYPVHEITVAGKLQDMYANIVEIGNDIDIRGNIRTGSILIKEMMIAGH